MRSSGKQPVKPDESSFSQLILPEELNRQDGDQERDEGSYNDKRDYQTGTRAFREIENDEMAAARDTAPDDTIEVLEVKAPEAKIGKKNVKDERKSRGKSKRPFKEE